MHILARKAMADAKAKQEQAELEGANSYGVCDCLAGTCFVCFPCVCDPISLPVPSSVWAQIWFEGTYPNEILKHVAGFLAGVVISTIAFYLMLEVFEVGLVKGAITGFLMATMLPLALAYSPKVRVITMLCFPAFCSDKGQALILAYIIGMVTAGAVLNFNYNAQVLAVTSLCTQEKLVETGKQLKDAALRPLETISEKAEAVAKSFQDFADSAEEKLDALAENFENIIDQAKRIKRWYDDATNFCNKNHGTKQDLCSESGENVEDVCRSVHFIAKLFCRPSADYVREQTCGGSQGGKNFICDIDVDIDINLFDQQRKDFLEAVAKKKRDIKEFFYYDVKFDRVSNLTEVKNTNYTVVIGKIKAELRERVIFLSKILWISQLTFFLFFLFIIIMSIRYLHKFHSKIYYDNHYINAYVIALDRKRKELHKDKESIFPLSFKEQLNYIKPLAKRITRGEFIRILINLLLLIPVVINLLLITVCDLGLWYTLSLMESVFEQDFEDELSGEVEIKVEGKGKLADSYKKILESGSDGDNAKGVESIWQCVPHPQEPDWASYRSMRNLIIYLFLMAFFQGYILRLRSFICSYCYPRRGRERAVYLYNEIIQLRGSFMTFLKRQILRGITKQENIEKVSICNRLAAGNRWLRPIMNALGHAQKFCVGCGQAGKVDDLKKFIHCKNYGCQAVYCKVCFGDLHNMCTSCMHPIDYGDFADENEERDSSSDEEAAKAPLTKLKPQMQSWQLAKLKTIQYQGKALKSMLYRQQQEEKGGQVPTEHSTPTYYDYYKHDACSGTLTDTDTYSGTLTDTYTDSGSYGHDSTYSYSNSDYSNESWSSGLDSTTYSGISVKKEVSAADGRITALPGKQSNIAPIKEQTKRKPSRKIAVGDKVMATSRKKPRSKRRRAERSTGGELTSVISDDTEENEEVIAIDGKPITPLRSKPRRRRTRSLLATEEGRRSKPRRRRRTRSLLATEEGRRSKPRRRRRTRSLLAIEESRRSKPRRRRRTRSLLAIEEGRRRKTIVTTLHRKSPEGKRRGRRASATPIEVITPSAEGITPITSPRRKSTKGKPKSRRVSATPIEEITPGMVGIIPSTTSRSKSTKEKPRSRRASVTLIEEITPGTVGIPLNTEGITPIISSQGKSMKGKPRSRRASAIPTEEITPNTEGITPITSPRMKSTNGRLKSRRASATPIEEIIPDMVGKTSSVTSRRKSTKGKPRNRRASAIPSEEITPITEGITPITSPRWKPTEGKPISGRPSATPIEKIIPGMVKKTPSTTSSRKSTIGKPRCRRASVAPIEEITPGMVRKTPSTTSCKKSTKGKPRSRRSSITPSEEMAPSAEGITPTTSPWRKSTKGKPRSRRTSATAEGFSDDN